MRTTRPAVVIGATIVVCGTWLIAARTGFTGTSDQTTFTPRSMALTFDDLPYVDVGEPVQIAGQQAGR
jgi:hypothetical protein